MGVTGNTAACLGAAWLVLAQSALAAPPHWGYEGEHGPEHWAHMDERYALCGAGSRQSPIDIAGAVRASLPPLEFDYGAAALDVASNGHTIQAAAGGAVRVGGERYRLLQVHFHAPSEESVDGRRYEMAAHLVHRDDAGRLAVVAVLFEAGRENAALGPIWRRLPRNPGEKAETGEPVDLAALLPARRGYYRYEGSLTTPPCSEGVTWFVLKEPAQLSRRQLENFRRLYPHNARPLQSANGREIFVSE